MFSHIYRQEGLHTFLSQGCVLENDSYCGNGGRKDRGECEELPVSRGYFVGQPQSHPLEDLLQKYLLNKGLNLGLHTCIEILTFALVQLFWVLIFHVCLAE